MGLSAAAWMGAAFQGEQLNAALDEKKAQTASIKIDQQYKQMQMLALKQKQQQEAEIGQWMAANSAAENAPGQTAEDQVKLYQQGAIALGSQGNFAGMEMMNKLAKEKLDQAKQIRVDQAAESQKKKEDLADSASSFVNGPTSQGMIELAKKAVAAGVNPATIPPPAAPGSPGGLAFLAWAKNQRTASMTGKQKMDFVEKQKEFQQKFTEDEQKHQDSVELRREAMAAAAAARQASLGMQQQALLLRGDLAKAAQADREDRRTLADNNAKFNQTEKLNAKVQREAAPMLKDRSVIQEVKGLLLADNSPSDQQINQALPALLGQLKGRATNAYYKDNKHFGDVADKLESILSKGFSGRYSDNDRHAIYDMVDRLENGTIDPALRHLESDQKAHAKRYGLDPEDITIQGDFTRADPNSGTATGSWGAAPKTPTTGGVADGTLAKNPTTGAVLVRKNGKWVPQ